MVISPTTWYMSNMMRMNPVRSPNIFYENDITAEEVDQITDDASIQDNLDDEINKEMMQEWDEHMSDFMPDDMLQVQLDPKTEIVSTIFRSFLTLTFV